MTDVVPTFSRRVEGESGGDECGDLIEAARPRRTEERFQFGEGEFDGIEVRAVGRQESEVRAGGLDRGPHLGLFVHRQVVEDDDVAAVQRRHQDLLDVGQEARIVDGAIEDRGGGQAIRPQPHDDRVRLPVTARRVIVEARAPETPTIAAQEVGRDATFIEKDVLSRVAERQPVSPLAAFSGDVGAPLLVGVNRFF
jgi:hypothetical protein